MFANQAAKVALGSVLVISAALVQITEIITSIGKRLLVAGFWRLQVSLMTMLEMGKSAQLECMTTQALSPRMECEKKTRRDEIGPCTTLFQDTPQ